MAAARQGETGSLGGGTRAYSLPCGRLAGKGVLSGPARRAPGKTALKLPPFPGVCYALLPEPKCSTPGRGPSPPSHDATLTRAPARKTARGKRGKENSKRAGQQQQWRAAATARAVGGVGQEGWPPKTRIHTHARLCPAAGPPSMSAYVMVGFGNFSLSHGSARSAPGLLVSGVGASPSASYSNALQVDQSGGGGHPSILAATRALTRWCSLAFPRSLHPANLRCAALRCPALPYAALPWLWAPGLPTSPLPGGRWGKGMGSAITLITLHRAAEAAPIRSRQALGISGVGWGRWFRS